MNLWDSVLVAWTALRTNLLRSFLTTLGIVIGVASVILLVAVGSGAAREVERQINSLGTSMLVVFPGSSRVLGRAAGAGTELPLSEMDMKSIRDKVSGVVAMSGQLDESGPVIKGNLNWVTVLSGVHAEYTTVRDWKIVAGRDLTPEDVRGAARVAVIGQTVARELFPGEDPVGGAIRIKNVPFDVVGVLERKGQSAMGRDQDDLLLLPITTARNRIVGKNDLQTDQVGRIYVKFDPSQNLSETQEEIEHVMRQRRKSTTGEDKFQVRNLAEFMKARTEVLSTMSYLLGATSAISLIVGGIGIMNIMLVSVTERTREIGLRMAVGGRRRDILMQFLVEAVVLCMMGGVIGVAIGVGISAGISHFAQWPMRVDPGVLMLAMSAAAATGIFFGFFPARRAAFLNPIDALRSE
jgi:putative ABC transport system permease protein